MHILVYEALGDISAGVSMAEATVINKLIGSCLLRRRTPGRPVTWGTAPSFLDHFNLNSLSDLPGVDELKAAGLLDTRPVRTIFGEVAAMQSDESDEAGNLDEESESEPEEVARVMHLRAVRIG